MGLNALLSLVSWVAVAPVALVLLSFLGLLLGRWFGAFSGASLGVLAWVCSPGPERRIVFLVENGVVLVVSWRELCFGLVCSGLVVGLLRGRWMERGTMVFLVLGSVWLCFGMESLFGFVLFLDLSSLVVVLLSARSFPLGYFMMQAWISGLLWLGMGLGVSIGLVVLLKCGAGMMLLWLFGLYGGVLWSARVSMVWVALLSYVLGWMSTLFLVMDGSSGLLLCLFVMSLFGLELFDLGAFSFVLLGLGVSSSVLLSSLAVLGAGLSWLYVLSSVLLVSVLSFSLLAFVRLGLWFVRLGRGVGKERV